MDAPGTTYLGQLWHEADANALHMRNETNSMWPDIAYIDQAKKTGWSRLPAIKWSTSSGAEQGKLDTHPEATYDVGLNQNPRLISPVSLKSATDANAPAAGRLCAAWAAIDQTGKQRPLDDCNGSGITDHGTGRIEVAIVDDIDNANFAVACAADRQGNFHDVMLTECGQSVSRVSIGCLDVRGVFLDGNPVSAIAFGNNASL